MGSIFSDCCKEDNVEIQNENDTKIPLLENDFLSNEPTKVWNYEGYYRTIKTARNIRNKYKKSKSW
jgi:hypothetical protein